MGEDDWKDGEIERRLGAPVMHTCHWPGCKTVVLPKFWGCRKHWYMLPYYLRSLIWFHYVPGQEVSKTPSRSYLEAYEVVENWIREHHDVND